MARVDATYTFVRARHRRQSQDDLRKLFSAVRDDVLARRGAGVRTLLATRWDEHLAEVLFDRGKAIGSEIGRNVTDALDALRSARVQEWRGFDPDLMDEWFDEWSGFAAEDFLGATRDLLDDADSLEEIEAILEEQAGQRADMLATYITLAGGNFGAQDGAKGGGAGTKTWHVTSGNPRSSHAGLSGSTVGIDDVFGNGMRWPGDPSGGAAELANCQCVMSFS